MSTTADSLQKLKQELQNELTNTNQLLIVISEELQKIKNLTSADGELLASIKQNGSLIATLANMQNLDNEYLPPIARST